MTEETLLDQQAIKMFNRFRSAYQKRGWTQVHLAQVLDVNISQLNRALRGTENTPKAKEIRSKARKLLNINDD